MLSSGKYVLNPDSDVINLNYVFDVPWLLP